MGAQAGAGGGRKGPQVAVIPLGKLEVALLQNEVELSRYQTW